MPKLWFGSAFSKAVRNDEALGVFGDSSPLQLQEVSASRAVFLGGR